MRFWLLAWLLCVSPALALDLHPRETLRLQFVTEPGGADIVQTSPGHAVLGHSGDIINFIVPATHRTLLNIRIELPFYYPRDLQLDTKDLHGSPAIVNVSDPLLPRWPWSPLLLSLMLHRVAAVTAAAAAALLMVGWGVPAWRRLQRRHRTIQRLLPPTAEQADPNLGRTAGGWLLTSVLGRGGCATVYRALPADSLNPDHAAAVKLIHRSAITPDFVERFRREVNICRSFNHPNLVQLLDWGSGNPFYMVMELVEGRTLRHFLRPGGMAVKEALDLVEQVCDGLQYAHERGVVHCDMKPENVMITPAGRVRIMDFGIATGRAFERLTSTQAVLGTPGYLAPEQFDGVRDDPRSDEYAVGCMVFEMLTGREVFDSGDPMIRIARHVTEVPPRVADVNPRVPETISDAVARMLEKQPANRFPTVGAAWEALRKL